MSRTMLGDMVHSPVDFAESLQVPLFVSCRPQGLGLAAGWFQDKHLFLPLVEGRVGVPGRDMPTVTLTRLENPGPRGPAFPRPALPVSGSPGGVPCCLQGLGRSGLSRSRQAVCPPRKPQHRLPCPACPGPRSPALCSRLALSLPRPLLSLGCHSAPEPPKAGAREGVRLGSDRCGALGLSPPLDSSGEPRSPPCIPSQVLLHTARPTLRQGDRVRGLRASRPAGAAVQHGTPGLLVLPTVQAEVLLGREPRNKTGSAVGGLAECCDCGEAIASSRRSFLGHLEPGWEAVGRAGSSSWLVSCETHLVGQWEGHTACWRLVLEPRAR